MIGAPLPPEFYTGNTADIAKRLLGTCLISTVDQLPTAGIIVETEAYPANDPASHAFCGKTPRNSPMFGNPGTGYIYKIYGLHFCFNVVTGAEGVGEAVLIRSLKPILGLDAMRGRRGSVAENKFCLGPGNLCRALGITPNLNGHKLKDAPLQLVYDYKRGDHDDLLVQHRIVAGPRIGITKAAKEPLRFQLV